MGVKGEPKISTGKTTDFTKITFTPDLEKFKMSELDDDIVSLFKVISHQLDSIFL